MTRVKPVQPDDGSRRPQGPQHSKKSEGTGKKFEPKKKEEGKAQKKDQADKKKDNPQADVDGLTSQMDTRLAGSEKAEAQEASQVKGSQLDGRIQTVNALIVQKVESMMAGEKGAQLVLKADNSIPDALKGAAISINMTQNGVSIDFKIPPTGNAEEATMLLQDNKEALQTLQKSLEAKGLHLQEMSVNGAQSISLPQTEKIQASQLFFGQQSSGGDKERRGGSEEGIERVDMDE